MENEQRLELLRILNLEISALCEDYRTNPDVFLTEEDVRSHLVSRLLSHIEFSTPSTTQDNSLSVPIHSEVRWYGSEGKMKYRSDIVLFSPGNLRVKDVTKLPSKGFSFNEYIAVIEIKLRRLKGESDNQYKALIRKDIDKLRMLQGDSNTGTQKEYHLLCFDKKNDLNIPPRDWVQGENIALQYVFSRQSNNISHENSDNPIHR